jgi:enhancing lycopene biosynthesis protein 2
LLCFSFFGLVHQNIKQEAAMTRVAVVLAGCGYLDGAEIREAVLSLLYLDQNGAKVQCFAPDIAQHHVIDHTAKAEAREPRNVLTESARIARSDIRPLSELNVDGFDALVLPGGYGVAKNLSDLAFKGDRATVYPDYARVIRAFFDAKKPIGAICIAPAVVAVALKNEGVTLTIGEDAGTAAVIVASGNVHKNSPTEEAVEDVAHRIVSCSAYMREDAIARVAEGIEKTIKAVLAMAKQHPQRKAS